MTALSSSSSSVGANAPPGPAVVLRKDPRGRRASASGRAYPAMNVMATAKKLGICRDHLDRILKGKGTPSWKMAKRIAEGLGITIADLEALSNAKSSTTTRYTTANKSLDNLTRAETGNGTGKRAAATTKPAKSFAQRSSRRPRGHVSV